MKKHYLRKQHKTVAILLSLALAACGLAGCKGGEGNSTAQTTAVQETEAATETETEAVTEALAPGFISGRY